jgi:transporter family-2 protein
MSVLWPFALLAGSCIAVQVAMNARLGKIVNNTWLATSYAFFTSFLLVFLIFLLLNTTSITIQWQQTSFSEVPWYL